MVTSPILNLSSNYWFTYSCFSLFAVEPEVPTLVIAEIGATSFNVSFVPGEFDNAVSRWYVEDT